MHLSLLIVQQLKYLKSLLIILLCFIVLIQCSTTDVPDKPAVYWIFGPPIEVEEGSNYIVRISWNNQFASSTNIYVIVRDKDETEVDSKYTIAEPGVHNDGMTFSPYSSSILTVGETYSMHLKWKDNDGNNVESEVVKYFTVIPSYIRSGFDLEYDHQWGLGLFALLENGFPAKLYNAFDRGYDGARTTVTLHPDQADQGNSDPMELVVWQWDYLHITQLDHYTLTEDESDFLHEGHLCVIVNVDVNFEPPPEGEEKELETGASLDAPPPGRGAWSIIFWDACQNNDQIVQVVIHELGHQRGQDYLPHLCMEDKKTINPEHNRDDCVMGQYIISPCTGQNLVNNPRFCGLCEFDLQNITY